MTSACSAIIVTNELFDIYSQDTVTSHGSFSSEPLTDVFIIQVVSPQIDDDLSI